MFPTSATTHPTRSPLMPGVERFQVICLIPAIGKVQVAGTFQISIFHAFPRQGPRRLALDVVSSDTILSVKQQIQTQWGYDTIFQELYFGITRTLLENSFTLASYGIQNGDTLNLDLVIVRRRMALSDANWGSNNVIDLSHHAILQTEPIITEISQSFGYTFRVGQKQQIIGLRLKYYCKTSENSCSNVFRFNLWNKQDIVPLNNEETFESTDTKDIWIYTIEFDPTYEFRNDILYSIQFMSSSDSYLEYGIYIGQPKRPSDNNQFTEMTSVFYENDSLVPTSVLHDIQAVFA